MGDMDYSKGVDAGRYSSGVTNSAAALVAQMRARSVSVFVAADGAVTTNLAEQVIYTHGNWSGGGKVADLRMTVVTNVTAGNSTNYAVIKVQSRDNAQGSALTVGIINCATTNLTAFVAQQFTFTKNQLNLVALGKLTLRHDKTGTGGLQLPAYTVTAIVEDT